MSFQAKPGTGVLFDNDYKQNDRQPDMKGSILLMDGTKMDISGWWKEGKSGNRFLSLSMQEPYVKKERPQERQPAPQPKQAKSQQSSFSPAPRRAPSGFDDMDDDVPF